MLLRLSIKEKEIFSYFLKKGNPPLNSNKIYGGLVEEGIKISKRTVKNTLDKYDQFNKEGEPALLIKELDKFTGGTCYVIKEDLETFIELARNLLKSKFAHQFFQSEYSQYLLKDKIIMKYIEDNLNVKFDNDTSFKIHQIIKNSPSALYFGLFAKDLQSQKIMDKDFLPEEAEHEIRENFLSRLLDDLRDKDFFLSENLERLSITLTMDWKFKEEKRTKFDLELKYEQ